MEKNPRKVFSFIDFPSAHNPPSTNESPAWTCITRDNYRSFWLEGEDERLKKERRNAFELFIVIAP